MKVVNGDDRTTEAGRSGTSTRSVLPATVPQLLHDQVQRHPDVPAIVAASHGTESELTTITYAQLDDSARRIAAGLREHGLTTGQKVGILLDNTCALEAMIAYHASHLLGAINVPLNVRFVPAELARAVRIAGIGVIVTQSRMRDTIEALLELVGTDLQVVVVGTQPDGWGLDWDAILQTAPYTAAAQVGPDDDADWIFTSGTTGSPKAARFSHAASVACGDGVRQAWTLTAGDVYQSASPFFTSTGIHTSPLGALSAGATYLIEPTMALPDLVAHAKTYRTTVVFLVSTMLNLLINQHGDDLPQMRLRRVVYGGMALPESTHRRFHHTLTTGHGIELMHLMGLTEGGPTGLYLGPEDQERKPGSVGNKPFSPDVKFKVVGDDGQPVAPGTVGELSFRGPSVMSGYVQDGDGHPEVTDGWIRTGDLVRQDEDGYVYFEDRRKDIVRRGGLNISSAEIESVLVLAPEITAAAVVAKPHEVLGEDICAFVEVVTPEVDLDALRESCRAHLASFKIPRDIRVVDQLPRNGMGRVMKADLREIAQRDPRSGAR